MAEINTFFSKLNYWLVQRHNKLLHLALCTWARMLKPGFYLPHSMFKVQPTSIAYEAIRKKHMHDLN